ncbi:MAG: isoprenyl transferase [Rhodomicrobium sp.]|nr:MAG: isoprenyl transferase [Rhodomicrobium sp.]
MRDQDEQTQQLRHVAIIMDGNGRWARKRGLPRTAGHKRGVEIVKQTVTKARELGLPYLTLFSFSSENWSRPKPEVDELMRLMKTFLRREQEQLFKGNVRVRIIGSPLGEQSDMGAMIRGIEEKTAENTGLQLTVAFNYGGRDEIVRAAKRLAKRVQAGELAPEDISEEHFSHALDTKEIPDPDLLIRTSGEYRISNFLLWQLAYSEFMFLDCNWPEFTPQKFDEAIAAFYARERRYGNVSARSTA